MSLAPSRFNQVSLINRLRGCRLFSGLPLPDLEHVAAITSVKTLARDQYVFHEGDPSHGFYIVQSGAINVHRISATGKEQVIHIFRAGETLAEATLATPAGYPAAARAVEPSTVWLIQKAGFLELLKHQPELGLRMLGSMSLHLRLLVGQIEDLTLKDVETRLANWLLKHCPDPNSERPMTINLGMTKRVLAAELGTVSETFSRMLAKFRDQKLIAVNGKSVTVLSPAKLASRVRSILGE
jgi:CRP/FNR family transcriptional regulator, dissimilatory nitrate respiration regulator